MLTPIALAQVRQLVLQWAVAGAKPGEEAAAVIGRAQAYLDFIFLPLRTDVQAAMEERIEARIQ